MEAEVPTPEVLSPVDSIQQPETLSPEVPTPVVLSPVDSIQKPLGKKFENEIAQIKELFKYRELNAGSMSLLLMKVMGRMGRCVASAILKAPFLNRFSSVDMACAGKG